MDAYVDRLIAYETSPPADPSRRLMRFVTNEARFGVLVDRLIETMFRSVLTSNIPAGYDIEVTFASPESPYLWPPPEFDDKVIEGFNDGCLFYTYVGHGFAQGFDSLRVGGRRFPVLHVDGADRVRCRQTPPAVFVVACTTATFDDPRSLGIGETLLANPAGPIAYWGATRICHPAANALLGRAIARHMSREEGRWRLGDILQHAARRGARRAGRPHARHDRHGRCARSRRARTPQPARPRGHVDVHAARRPGARGSPCPRRGSTSRPRWTPSAGSR